MPLAKRLIKLKVTQFRLGYHRFNTYVYDIEKYRKVLIIFDIRYISINLLFKEKCLD